MAGYGFQLDPQTLAQLAAQSYRPPAGVVMPGLNLTPPAAPSGLVQPQGFGLGDGMALAGLALQAAGRYPRTPSSPSTPLTPASVGGNALPGQTLPTSAIDNAIATGAVTPDSSQAGTVGPAPAWDTGTQQQPDFLSFLDWIGRKFGRGGSTSA